MKALVLGAAGQVGWELCRVLAAQGEVLACTRAEADLAEPAGLRELVRRTAPDAIVNAAAYTAVDRAESEPALAQRVNGEAPAVLAEAARRSGALLIHYSTDYVFDGSKAAPYVESDPPAPLGVYGRSKLAGEQAVREAGGAHLVLRTSWVYGLRGHNFLLTILRLAREREELRVVADQVGTPNWSRLLAEATGVLVGRMLALPAEERRERSGLYHLTSAGEATWHAFAEAILTLDPHRSEQRARRVVPIPSSEYPLPAKRPANSRLDGSALARDFGLRPVHWRTALELALGSGAS
jgi:dTDP-4-dehydrorhamnose reductase